ncbi:radical SAM/SPASM domain-containing protein [Candidatus Termititenax aidoneus]|uniref:Radical SAM/SPASM domain-containing protein n=1 Tax=Termititenax aidoneus TaxID=2218524 RepID=A0A388TAF3_TERA1|nr:radical SAM/SPASM domain-containing protein [Candidatus Termititenax aidoneus]
MTDRGRVKERLLPAAYRLNTYEVFMTWDCNLRCVYCYECVAGKDTAERREEKKGAMTSEKITEVVNFIAETHDKNAKELRIIFWGGEPFLAFEQIKEMIAKIEQAQADGRIEKEVSYTTTSNLTVLTLEQMQYLQTKRFSILVSFDGLEKTTDQNRGKGTFAKVIKNMALLHGLRIPFSIRMTVSLEQIDSLGRNLEFVNDLGHKFWWSLDSTKKTLAQDDIEKILNILLWFHQSYPNNFAETLSRHLRKRDKNFCIDPYRQITIDPAGDLRVCSRVDYVIGNIREGVTKYSEIRDWPFYSGKPLKICADCLVYDKCKGGCLGEHFEKNKNLSADYKLNTAQCQEILMMHLLNENLILKQQYASLKKEEEKELCHIPTI